MDKQERANEIITRLEKAYPHVQGTSLHYDNALELLVSTMLSAQATDEQINKITKERRHQFP